jgi:hypothetical protein
MPRRPSGLDAELGGRFGFEMLLAELSAHFVAGTADTIDSEIVNAQRQILVALDQDRCTPAQVQNNGKL